jgi:hypothetical protein
LPHLIKAEATPGALRLDAIPDSAYDGDAVRSDARIPRAHDSPGICRKKELSPPFSLGGDALNATLAEAIAEISLASTVKATPVLL